MTSRQTGETAHHHMAKCADSSSLWHRTGARSTLPEINPVRHTCQASPCWGGPVTWTDAPSNQQH